MVISTTHFGHKNIITYSEYEVDVDAV